MTTIETIKAANEAAGQYFFTEGAMTFFSSVIHPEIYRGRYFVTSEQADGQPRRYTVREAIDGGADIGKLGEFQQHETLEAAISAARGDDE